MSGRIGAFQKAMAFEEVDEIPVIPLMSGWIARFSGIPFESLIRDPGSVVRIQVAAQEAVGYDALFGGMDAVFVPEAYGCSVTCSSSGALDALTLHVETPEDVETLPIPNIRKDGRFPAMLEIADRLVNLRGRKVPVLCGVEGPFTNCARIIGTEKVMRAVKKSMPLVERLLQSVEKTLSRYAHALEEIGVDGLIVADPCGSTTMVSPLIFREVVFPALQRFIMSTSIPVILHVCGDTYPILGTMAETGASVLSLDQCMDLDSAKRQIACRCGIGGNVDPINVLLQGSVEDVKRETERCLRVGGKRGFVLMPGCSVPPDTPIENLRAMVRNAK